MAILINKSAPCDFALSGKTISLKGNSEITVIDDGDFKALLKAYPSVKGFIDGGYITVGSKSTDNAKADAEAKAVREEEERAKKAKIEAEKVAFDAQVAELVKGGMKKEDAVKKIQADIEAAKGN